MGHTSHLSGHGRYRDQSVIVPGTRTIDPANPADVASHDRMVALVERCSPFTNTYLKRRPIRSIHPSGGRSRAADAAIDALVYDLYWLTEEEIEVVETPQK